MMLSSFFFQPSKHIVECLIFRANISLALSANRNPHSNSLNCSIYHFYMNTVAKVIVAEALFLEFKVSEMKNMEYGETEKMIAAMFSLVG